jgi:cyclopropane-fatty-acyl-phospholipid synthase
MPDSSPPAFPTDRALTPQRPKALHERLLLRIIRHIRAGRLTIATRSGAVLEHAAATPGPAASLMLHRWRALRRLLLEGDVGFAEAYIDGDWSSPDLASLIELAAVNMEGVQQGLSGARVSRLVNRLRHLVRANTRRGARRNIVAHYDLGNEFYAAWLDRGMSYSSAIYTAPGQSLETAQQHKQDRVLAALDLAGGERVLEIGCGWGGLAARLVRERECRLVGLTLSPAQLDFARSALAPEIAAGQAELRLQDYRDVAGQFDRIVSIEMLEAVGEAYWPAYFSRIAEMLAPGGVAVLQAITIAEERFAPYRAAPDFIQRHIFPGGMLPTKTILREQVARAGLALRHAETFGMSYAATLAEWRRRFHLCWPKLETMGFDAAFRRKWDYYLAYCEGGFRAAAIDVGLYQLVRPGKPG